MYNLRVHPSLPSGKPAVGNLSQLMLRQPLQKALWVTLLGPAGLDISPGHVTSLHQWEVAHGTQLLLCFTVFLLQGALNSMSRNMSSKVGLFIVKPSHFKILPGKPIWYSVEEERYVTCVTSFNLYLQQKQNRTATWLKMRGCDSSVQWEIWAPNYSHQHLRLWFFQWSCMDVRVGL